MKLNALNRATAKYKKLPQPVKASLWFLVCSFMQRGITTITTPIFTRLLSTTEYGQYSTFNSWLSIITIFVTLNLSYGVYTQGLVKFSEERNDFSAAFQGLTLVLCLAWTLIYILFRDFWNHLFALTTLQMLAMLAMIWSTAVFNLWAAGQRVQYKYKSLVILTIIVSVCKPVVGFILVTHSEDKVTARIVGIALVEVLGYAGLFINQLKHGGNLYSAKVWKYALKFNLPLIPHYLSQTVLNSSDRIMIREMVGEAETGIYSLAYQISLVMTLFNTALMQTISPWIYQKIKQQKENEIAPIAYATLALIAVVNIVLIAFAPEIVGIFAPVEYGDAIYVIPPVAMSVFFIYCYDLFAKFEFYFEKTNIIAFTSVIGAALNVVLNYVCINKFGYVAAGYTTLICYIFYAVIHYICMNKVCDKYCNGCRPYQLRAIFKISLAFICGGFALMLTYRAVAIRYCVIMLLAVILFRRRKAIEQTIKELLSIRQSKETRT